MRTQFHALLVGIVLSTLAVESSLSQSLSSRPVTHSSAVGVVKDEP